MRPESEPARSGPEPVRVVMGLGNPGPEYDRTRHNVGWWVVDRVAYDGSFPPFEREGSALVTEASLEGRPVRLVKPLTWMNRSGSALAALSELRSFEPSAHLLVVVDDATREVGRVRFRPGGSPGGHRGLLSVERAVGHRDWARLRVGVGRAPEGEDLAEWVLSPMDEEDEEVVVGLLPELSEAVRLWVDEGVEAAMNRYNR